MNLEEYQTEAFKLARYPQRGEGQLWYPGLGLMGEYSEVLEKIALEEDFLEEAGDMVWYMNSLCIEVKSSLVEACNIARKYGVFTNEECRMRPIFLVGKCAGRAVEHIKKAYRDDDYPNAPLKRQYPILDSIGKSLIATELLLSDYGSTLNQCLEMNIEKLRNKKGTQKKTMRSFNDRNE